MTAAGWGMVVSGGQAGLRKNQPSFHPNSHGRTPECQDGPWLSLGSLWLQSEWQKTWLGGEEFIRLK